MAFGIYVYACMRTTLILNEQLIRRAKREAGDKGATLSGFVNRAPRNYFFTKSDEGKQVVFTMPVFFVKRFIFTKQPGIWPNSGMKGAEFRC